jgi:Xaa-Pro dipeptidase
MNNFYARRKKLAESLSQSGIALAMFEDCEGRRDQAIRYFTGQPGDALLFIAADGRSILVPWDVNMAKKMAQIEMIIDYTIYNRQPLIAMKDILMQFQIPKGQKIELPAATPYILFNEYAESLPDWNFVCIKDGASKTVEIMRAVKDDEEIALYRIIGEKTDKAMDAVESGIRSGKLSTEADVALFIERFAREESCESTGFPSLVAGPSRSFGIHAFPNFTNAAFAVNGMSILDFGLCYEGYTSDITMSFVRGPITAKQKEMIELVKTVYGKVLEACKPGTKGRDLGKIADDLFAAKGYKMPHALGHGIGLEPHEGPGLRNREDNTWVLDSGHIIAIEPGLYNPELGGVRLEDDVLITEQGYEVLTHSRIVEL